MLPLGKHGGQLVPQGELGNLRTHLNKEPIDCEDGRIGSRLLGLGQCVLDLLQILRIERQNLKPHFLGCGRDCLTHDDACIVGGIRQERYAGAPG